jgi:hypothetical protein
LTYDFPLGRSYLYDQASKHSKIGFFLTVAPC